MSVHYTALCLMCDETGPDLRDSGGRMTMIGRDEDGKLILDNVAEEASNTWVDFMRKHEWCPVVLSHETGPHTAERWLNHPGLPFPPA